MKYYNLARSWNIDTLRSAKVNVFNKPVILLTVSTYYSCWKEGTAT